MREKKIYETHVESLLRLLSFQDIETEEHTRRVTTLTLSFARLWGIPEERLLHIRWGAQLHDIGKVGIPDAILHKKGALTVEEQAVIRMHPIYAYELLYPVSYLRPALAIPYSHHEKWDGSGYPQGCKGTKFLSRRGCLRLSMYGMRCFRIVRTAQPGQGIKRLHIYVTNPENI